MTDVVAHPSWPWRHRVGIGLVLILCFGAGLRFQYALPGLDSNRFWDERYSFDNVRKVLDTWSFEPGSIYYPSPLQTWPQALIVAASQWLYEERGIEEAQIVHRRGWFTPTAYLLVRLISVLYGTLTLAVLYLVGRRLVSPTVGLLAALALAALPMHIHVSAMFKPDALLVLGVVLAFHRSLIAIETGRPRDYALAGFAICLAMSAKIMGGLVALTLVIGTLVIGWKDRRRMALLTLTAGTSLLSFLILNPYARYYLGYTAHLQADYARRAELHGMTRAEMPGALADYLSGPHVHGPIFATLALIGLLWLAASLWHPLALAPVSRAHRAMLVAFPPLYAGAYMASTPYFKGNNVLPIAPFTTLAALWLVWEVWRRLYRRTPALRNRSAPVLGVAVLVLALAAPGPLSVYRTLTPTTFDRALGFLARGRGPVLGRVVFAEQSAEPAIVWKMATDAAAQAPGLVRPERLEEIESRRLDLSDGEIFLDSRLHGAGADLYQHRVDRLPEEHVVTFEPRLFELRGPPMVALRHTRRLAAAPQTVRMSLCPPGEPPCYEGTLPDGIEPGHLISLVAVVPWDVVEQGDGAPSLKVGDLDRPLREAFRHVQVVTLVTERFVLGKAQRRVSLATGQLGENRPRIKVEVRRWRQPRRPGESPLPG